MNWGEFREVSEARKKIFLVCDAVQGGMANLAVLGGNLPPSFGTVNSRITWCVLGAPDAAGW